MSTQPCSAVNGTQIATSTPSTAATRGSERGDVRLRLRDRLVHLPVARDERGATAQRRTSTPGSGLPLDKLERRAASGGQVRHLVLQPELRERGGRVASSDNRRTRAGGDRIGDLLASPPRTVRARTRPSGRSRRPWPRGAPRSTYASARLRADVEAHPAVGHVDAVELLALGVGGELAAEHEVDGQPQLAPLVEQPPRGLGALLLAQRGPDVMALRREEREAHRPADEHRRRRPRGTARGRRSCRSPSRRRRPRRAGAPGPRGST